MAVARPKANNAFRTFTGAVSVVTAIAVILQSAHALEVSWDNAAVIDLAALLENGLPSDRDYLARFQQAYSLEHPSPECDDLLTRSRLTIDLSALDAAVAAKDQNSIEANSQIALDSAKSRLICSPMDGNAWLRYATSLAHLKGPVPEAIDALQLSYTTAPNESWVIDRRLPFGTYLYSAGVASIEPQFVRDLRLFVHYQPRDLVAQSYVQATPKLQALFHPLIADEPADRKNDIIAQIDQLGVVFDPK